MHELFRLSEDEAGLVQLYRVLSDDTKAAILTLVMLHAEQVSEQTDNIVSFARATLPI